MNLKTNNKGFTLIELLIVIVVIAILAAISVIAYTGIQNRAKTSSGQQLASQVANKAQAYFTIKSNYPADVDAFEDSDATEAALDDSGNVLDDVTPFGATQADGGKKVNYKPCGTTPNFTGAQVTYYDYADKGTKSVDVGSGC